MYLGQSADTRHYYEATARGRENLRAMPTYLNQWAAQHIEEAHPERQSWLSESLEAVCAAVAQPQLYCTPS